MKWTIRKKFFLGFLLLFTIAALLFNEIIEKTIENNTMTVIQNDLTKLQHTSKEYIKQFSQLHNAKEDLFTEHGNTIVQELSKLHAQSVAVYKADGQFLYEAVPVNIPILMENQKYETNINENSSNELQQAFQNKAAYTPKKLTKGTIIYFAYPVYIQDELYGVLRFTGDYSEMYKHNQQLMHSFTFLTIILFVGVFVISLLLTSRIIKPIRTLTNATKRIADGDYSMNTSIHTSDEIGELATQFQHMQNEIRQQIHVIESEKEKVLVLEKKRTDFFHNVTHELKTPLATISGYAQIIGENDFDDAIFLKKAAHKIRSESNRLNDMVSQLLSFSKAQSETTVKNEEVFDLFPMIQSICEDLQLKANKYTMPIHLTGQSFMMYGNKDKMRQVIINVIDNAIKHGLSNHPIEVSVNNQITIINHSDPIPPNIIAHAFEPFIHTVAKGSHGLGLFICAQIIEQYNGTILFYYQQPQAFVKIILPRLATNRQ